MNAPLQSPICAQNKCEGRVGGSSCGPVTVTINHPNHVARSGPPYVLHDTFRLLTFFSLHFWVSVTRCNTHKSCRVNTVFAVGLWPSLISRPKRPGPMKTARCVAMLGVLCPRAVRKRQPTRKRGRFACTVPLTTGLFLRA